MRFRDVVDELENYHSQLWFRSGSKLSGPTDQYPDEWKGSTIVSAGGKLLAFQIKNADEWQLASGHQISDGKLDFHDDEAEEELITPGFVSSANFIICWVANDPGESD